MRHIRPRQGIYLALLLLGSAASAQPQLNVPSLAANEAALSPILNSQVAERNFGFVIGDLLVQRIVLPVDSPVPDISELSTLSRISIWLERQNAHIRLLDNSRHELTIRYQIVNAPQNIVHAALPELRLTPEVIKGNDSANSEPLQVAAWPFTLGPLITSSRAADPAAEEPSTGLVLRHFHTLPPLDSHTPASRLRISLLMLGCTVLAWSSWFLWRRHRDIERLPFSKACHTLERQAGKHLAQTDQESAWQILHHAFNQVNGQVLTPAKLASLYEQLPWLQPLDSRIRAFFEASAARHFELPPREEPFAITELARTLAKREQSNSHSSR